MQAEIKKETEDGFGVLVIDNNGAEHKIGICFDGEIDGHLCDAYADDPAHRTPEENEYNEQARKFAQYYVFMNEGYDTVKPKRKHPLRLLFVKHAISEMDLDEFEDHFGDLFQQLKSHFDEDTERVLTAPADSQNEDYHLYRKEVYLGLDPFDSDVEADARDLAERYDLDVDAQSPTNTTVDELSADAVDAWSAFSKDLLSRLSEDQAVDLADGFYVETVSELHMAYLDHDGREQITTAMGPDREPDALIEEPVADPRNMEHFKAGIEFVLLCQIRDYYVRMGVTPPEEFQVLGLGHVAAAQKYDEVDFYPNFHLPQEEGALFGDLDPKYFGDDSMLGSVRSLLG